MIHHSLRAALAACLAFTFAPSAFAHMTLETTEAAVGSSYKAVLRVPHGCAGEATHTLRVTIPEGFHSVKPMPHAGWTLETVTGPYAKTHMNHGTEVSHGVKEIIWSGGSLADAHYDEFAFRGTFAADLAPGSTFYFPSVQVCANGTAEWVNVTGAADGGEPAPSLVLVGGATGHHNHGAGHGAGHDAGHAAAHGGPVVVGHLALSEAFTRAMPPNARTGGGFVTITNSGVESDRLVAASSPAAPEVQLHSMVIENNVMIMRELENGIDIPAGGSVELKPGGLHLMFIDAPTPFAAGESIPVVLEFEKAGRVEIVLPVAPLGATTMPEAHRH